MKKEKRELNLEQLKRIRKIAKIIALVVYWLCFVSAITGIIIAKIAEINSDKLIYFICLIMFSSLAIWIFFVDSYIESKIRDKEDELKVTKIKSKAKKGNLKNTIILKSENIQNEILSSNIDKIVLRGKVNEILIVEIFLKNGSCLPVNLKEEKVLSILSEKTKENILEKVINSITIEDLEKSTMQVKIDTKGEIITQIADDYNLLGWFDLKE